jgi:hypothetical protein
VVGLTQVQTFSIRNSSGDRIILGEAAISPAGSEDYIVEKDSCSRQRLDPSHSCSIDVVFIPRSEGLKSAGLLVPYRARGNRNAIQVPLSGTGVKLQKRLTISRAGSGSGTVTSTPSGIECGTTCTAVFETGSMVTLKAVPDEGSGFAAWSGDYTATDPAIAVLLSQDLSIAASFTVFSSLAIASPNGGETWKTGEAQIIRWTYSGYPGAFVKIQLYKGGVPNELIASRIPAGRNGEGFYVWRVPPTTSPGDDYKIRVDSRSNHLIADSSDDYFRIAK